MSDANSVNPRVSGAPRVTSGTNGHDFDFTWNGSIAATLPQAIKGARDLIAAQIQSGAVNRNSTITINADNTFRLHISKDVSLLFFTQTVTVNCTGTLAASADGKSTVFSMTNGTVDAGGLGDASTVTSQLTTWVGNWETQAQKEPRAPSPGLTLG